MTLVEVPRPTGCALSVPDDDEGPDDVDDLVPKDESQSLVPGVGPLSPGKPFYVKGWSFSLR